LKPNLAKDEKGELHRILNRWKNHFCQSLNVHETNDVTETDIQPSH